MKITTFLTFVFFVSNLVFAQEHVKVKVLCGNETGILRRSELYNNNSLLRTPSDVIVQKYFDEIGMAKIMRCWVTIDDYWNPVTNKYNFNFPCGWDLNNWDSYYHYLDRFSRMSKEILLNVRGYNDEVLKGNITMEQWRTACKKGIKHYKELFPRIKYIEALNEFWGLNVKDAEGSVGERYYKFYIEFYNIVNEINDELKPDIPLLTGGPCIVGGSLIDGRKREDMRDFLRIYANDTDPNKKLDFISYHDYGSANNPSLFKNHERLIDEWCEEFGLPTNIPIFLNEMGDNTRERYNNTLIQNNQLLQASCMASLFYFLKDQPDIRGFHWVIQHKNQDRKNQIYDNLRWSPYGMSLKMQARMAETEIKVETPKLDEGKGIYCVASKKDKKITVLLWNYQWETGNQTYEVELIVENLISEETSRNMNIKEYLLDLKHNNIHTDYPLLSDSDPSEEQLKITNENLISVSENVTYYVNLEPNAMCLLEIETD